VDRRLLVTYLPRRLNHFTGMAASDLQLAAGRSLASDLRDIRKKHGVDRKVVLDSTRLADDVIDQLEEDVLLNHPAFNKVYLRSLLCAYGDAIGLDREDVLSALEAVYDGTYNGALGRVFLAHEQMSASEAESADASPGTDVQVTAEKGSHEQDNPNVPAGTGLDSSPVAPDLELELESNVDPSEGMPGEDDIDSRRHEDRPNPKEVFEPKDVLNPEDQPRPHDPSGTVDSMPGLIQRMNAWGRDRKTFLLPNMNGVSMALLVGGAFIVLVWLAVSTLRGLSVSQEVPAAAADSTLEARSIKPPPIVLPDSLTGAIIAATEPLDPIRVTVDRDLRKPYWVEFQDTIRFVFRDRLLLEREVDHTRVLVDDFALPQKWLLEPGPLDITRQRVQSWLDSLVAAGAPPQREAASFSMPPDSP
jgi:hypothetical protein